MKSVVASSAVLCLAVLAGVSAQNTTCVAQGAFADCFKSRSAALAACPSTDLACLCRQSNEMVFCYVNFCDTNAELRSASCVRNDYCLRSGGNITVPGWSGQCSGAVPAGSAGPAGSPSATNVIPSATPVTTTLSNGVVVTYTPTPTASPSPPAENSSSHAASVAGGMLVAAVAALAGLV
ncbi:hypothetical protein PhCBS80983_g05435 [Powellomyces hirtus]|uniref:Extracellular membrane protein CFEM domain-containing protein n=1 Tax=Powellomyces hirtus TaxID=109895 RepID=A0A507DVS7_9FUNG|nr:hypothetical protein PhCBS80983_g05435 [Powellomyces hirtus]